MASYAEAKVCTFGSELLDVESSARTCEGEEPVMEFLKQLLAEESGQDIAEYAVMLAVILVIVVGTIRLIGSNANTVFSQVGSAIQ
jgi:pilus assembly protein Flp/PilA